MVKKELRIAAGIIVIIPAAILSLFLLTSIIRYKRSLQLDLGHSITERLLIGQIHSYHIKLTSNEYVRVSFAQQGGKATISLIDQRNSKRVEMNSSLWRKLSVSTISDEAADLTVDVRAVTASPLTYQLVVEDKRPAQPSDRLKVKAEKYIAEAEQLYKDGGPEKYQAAIEKYKIAVENWDQAGQPNEKAYALLKIGNIHYLLGNLEESKNHLDQSLALYQQSNDVNGQVVANNDLSVVYLQQGKREKAQEYCIRALRLSQSINYKEGQAEAFVNQGKINNVLEKPETALGLLTDALRIWTELGDDEKQATTYLEIGASYYYLGQYKNAINSRSQALNLFQKIKDSQGQARTLTYLGNHYSTIGDKQEALRHYRMAYTLLEKAGDRRTEASLSGGMSFVYTELGETQKALEYRERALAITRQIGDRMNESICLMHIGELHQILRQYNQALSNLQQARLVAEEIKDRRIEAQVLQSLGVVYLSLKAPQTAMHYYQQAIALYPQTYSPRWKAYPYNSIGGIYAQRGNLQKAITHYQQALEYNLVAEDRFGESQTRYHLARLYCDNGYWPEAIAQTEKAVALIESLRSKVFSQELRTSYFASVNQIYSLYVDVLMRQQQGALPNRFSIDALTVSERARARSLLDLLNDSHHNIKQGADSKLLELERTLLQEFNSNAERKMRLAGNKDKEQESVTLSQKLDSLNSEIEEVRTKIRETSPRYAALTQPQPLKAPEIQQLLDDNTMLLEFSLGEERSYVWAVTKDSLEAFTLPKRAVIEELSNEVYALMTAPQPQENELPPARLIRLKQAAGRYWPKAAELSQILLAPMADRLGNKRLIIVSDGALQRIPFAALPEPEAQLRVLGSAFREQTAKPETRNSKPLIANHEISYLPSASILSILRKERLPQQPVAPTRLAVMWNSVWSWYRTPTVPVSAALDSVAILADPVFNLDDPRLQKNAPLPGRPDTLPAQTRDVDLSDENLYINRLTETASEAGEIEQAAGTKAFLLRKGTAVNRALLEGNELNRYSIVHFATHGFWDSDHPELSCLVLSRFDQQGNKQDGYLRLSDIYNLRLPKELVVLSACETALGKDIRGEGLIALTRGFMYAGASRVMASLWKVDESATVELMKVFYGKLLREKLTPTAALRAAQIAMWQQDPTRTPYDWAAFVLQGEYR